MRKFLYALTVAALVSVGLVAQQSGGAFIPSFDYTIPGNWTLSGSNTHSGTADITGTFKIGGTTVAATAAELNNAADLSARKVAAGSSLTLTAAAHDGHIIELDTAAGSTVTLPASSGSGAVFVIVVKTLATSNSHIIKVANATDVMRGVVRSVDTDTSDAVGHFAAATASDTITLNRSTTGSVSIGERFVLIDSAAGFWTVDGWYGATGAPATPFSAGVS